MFSGPVKLSDTYQFQIFRLHHPDTQLTCCVFCCMYQG